MKTPKINKTKAFESSKRILLDQLKRKLITQESFEERLVLIKKQYRY